MSLRENSMQLREAWNTFWKARNRRERHFLQAAIAAAVIGALYGLAIDPAWTQRAALEKSLPLLRQQSTQMHHLAQQLAAVPPASSSPSDLTRDTLEASLKSRGLTANEINVSDRTVQLQFASASLVRLLAWLEQAQTQRLSVTDADIQTLANTDAVKATVMLTRTIEEQQ
jgi:type II secretory pathway component PulM